MDIITELAHNVYESFENTEFGTDIMLDMSKDFDTIDHGILLRKLKWYGIRGRAFNRNENHLK